MDTTPDLDRYTSRRSTVYATDGIVATSQPLAAEAGIETLREGGNAFDAAVATAATLNVVEPMSTGLGGDVFALYHTADGEVGALRSCGGAPAEASIDTVRAAIAENIIDDPEDVTMPQTGAHTVTVPGTARGWEATIEELGRLSIGDVLQPSIRYATEGYPVSEIIASYWQTEEKSLTDEHARAAYLPDGRAPQVGERVRLPALGETLQTIAEEGADPVYEGAIAEQIATEVQEKGGFLTTDDLAAFEPEFVEPVSTTYRGAEVYELPPNNQGLIALEALNIAEEIDAGSHPEDSAARIHALAEAMKRAFHDGHRYITDPDYEEVPPLAVKEYARERATSIDEQASEVSFGVPNANAEDADTVLLTVADSEGNVVSYINSLFGGFGSGLVAGETGITLQNRGASFSLNPDHPNRLEPGKKPFHTLIPAVAKFDENDWAAFGVMGGYMQPQGHLQVLSSLIDDELPLQAALDRPRWRYREDGALAVEARMDEAILSKLVRKGHDVRVQSPVDFGGAQIARNREDVLSGATDPRKDGTAIGY